MTGQDWGSEGLASDQARAKGPLHIMVHARQVWVLCSKALKVLLVYVCVCGRACVPACEPATSSSNLQEAAASEPGRAGDLVKGLTFSFKSGFVEWGDFRSEEVPCCFKTCVFACSLEWMFSLHWWEIAALCSLFLWAHSFVFLRNPVPHFLFYILFTHIRHLQK